MDKTELVNIFILYDLISSARSPLILQLKHHFILESVDFLKTVYTT